jgi:hypothetical protein
MKVNPSIRTSVFRFAVLILLLFSCVPVSLLTGTGAAASSLSRVVPQLPPLSIGGQLKNCRVSSTDPSIDTGPLQQALSTLAMDVSATGLVTAECTGSFVDPKFPEVPRSS